MRALKVLVIGMGVLIVAAVATIAFTLVDRAGETVGGKPWTSNLIVPPGAAIRDFRLAGERLVVRLSRPGLPDQLRVIDLASGRQIGVITMKNAGKP